MKIVQSDETESTHASLHREGAAYRKLLLEGEPGIDNFSLVISRSEARFSPRHRHNFEQFRYQLAGTADYSETGTLETGMLGYFPEAVRYGPQLQGDEKDLEVLCLQCGGASGSGYVSRPEVLAAARELQDLGTFKDGVFHRKKARFGKRKVEGSQAIWEHIMDRPLVYPEPRYASPFLMNPDSFDWRPVDGAEGVYEKPMGVFTERNTASGFVKLDAGAAYALGTDGRDVYFVLKGAGTAGEEDYRWGTAIYLDAGERLPLTADEDSEILHFRLPDMEDLKAAQMDTETAAANRPSA